MTLGGAREGVGPEENLFEATPRPANRSTPWAVAEGMLEVAGGKTPPDGARGRRPDKVPGTGRPRKDPEAPEAVLGLLGPNGSPEVAEERGLKKTSERSQAGPGRQ